MFQEVAPQPLFIVAEYWSHEVEKLQQYIDLVEGKTMLFDAPLQMKFHEASRQGRDYDMSQIFSGTLVEADPLPCRHLVTNHDTQPLQALEAPVEPRFKPLAYALILLRGRMACPRSFMPISSALPMRIPAATERPMPLRCPLSNNSTS